MLDVLKREGKLSGAILALGLGATVLTNVQTTAEQVVSIMDENDFGGYSQDYANTQECITDRGKDGVRVVCDGKTLFEIRRHGNLETITAHSKPHGCTEIIRESDPSTLRKYLNQYSILKPLVDALSEPLYTKVRSC